MVHHMARWSSGLRLRPLTPATRVRISYGSPIPKASAEFSADFHDRTLGDLFSGFWIKSVSMAVRVHPFPSRTRQLSSLALTILGWKRPGKISRCQHKRSDERILSSLLFILLRKQRLRHSRGYSKGLGGKRPATQAKNSMAPVCSLGPCRAAMHRVASRVPLGEDTDAAFPTDAGWYNVSPGVSYG